MAGSVKINGFKNAVQLLKGPYWTLYYAVRIDSGTQHLLQVLDPSVAGDQQLVALFRGLLHFTSVLRHDSILTPIDFGETPEFKFLLYDYFNGQSLRSLLDANVPLVERRVVTIIKQVTEILQFAQLRGIRHGWVSPDVVLFSQFSEEVKVFGFGSDAILAYLYDKNPDMAKNINPYLPPESLALATQPTPDDCYALGVLFYQLLLGQLPFSKEKIADLKKEKLSFIAPPHQLNPKLSQQVSEMALSLLEPRPQVRATFSSLLNIFSPQEDNIIHLDRPFVEVESRLAKVQSLFSSVNPVSKNLVGSKKRITYTIIAGLFFLVILLSVVVFTQLSSRDDRRYQRVYDEFLAEQRMDKTDSAHLSAKTRFESTSDSAADSMKTVERIPAPASTVNGVMESQMPATQNNQELLPEELTPMTAPQAAELVISVTANSQRVAADIFVDGQLRGQSGENSSFLLKDLLVNNSYTIKVIKDGFQNWEQRVQIKENGDDTIQVQLAPAPSAKKMFTFAPVSFANKIRLDEETESRNLPCNVELPLGIINVTFMDTRTDFMWSTQVELKEDESTISMPAEQVGSGDVVIVLEDPIQYGYAFVKINEGADQFTTPLRATLPAGWHHIHIFRQDYKISPTDTSIFVRPGAKISLRCKVH